MKGLSNITQKFFIHIVHNYLHFHYILHLTFSFCKPSTTGNPLCGVNSEGSFVLPDFQHAHFITNWRIQGSNSEHGYEHGPELNVTCRSQKTILTYTFISTETLPLLVQN